MSTNSICNNCNHKCGSLEFRLSNIEEKLSAMLQSTTTATAENGVEIKLNLLQTQITFINGWIKTQFGVDVINNVDSSPALVNNANHATSNLNSIDHETNEVQTTNNSELILPDSFATTEYPVNQGVIQTKIEDMRSNEKVEIDFDELYSSTSTTTATTTSGPLIIIKNTFQQEQEISELPKSKFVLQPESHNSQAIGQEEQIQLQPVPETQQSPTRRRGPYRPKKNLLKPPSSSKSIPKLDSNKVPAQASQKKPVCQLCCKTFYDKSNLRKHHLRMHSTQARYTCKLCNTSCVNPSELNVHMKRFHGPERKKSCKFACEPCQLFYHRRTNLLQHNALKHQI